MSAAPQVSESVESTRLYLITPPKIDLQTFPAKLEEAFSGGDIACVQLRLKDARDEEILAAAGVLEPIIHRHGAAFILNDRPDLVSACKADGVHLGQEDLERWPIAKTRKVVGEDGIIGVSCHASKHLAMQAGEEGADVVAFGAFYETKSKPMEKLLKWGTPEPDILTWWSTHTVLPCIAIGGITPANAAPLITAGADFIAVITAVWQHAAGPAAAVQELNEIVKRHSHPNGNGAV